MGKRERVQLPTEPGKVMELGLEVVQEMVRPDLIETPDISDIEYEEGQNWLPDIDDAGNPQPWAQQENEPTRAYALFRYYCTLPRWQRSYVAVAKHYGEENVSQGSVSGYASRYDWPERVRAWDAALDRVYQIKVLEKLRETGERHGRILENGIEAVAIAFRPIIDRIQSDPEGVIEELGEKSLVQLFNMAIKATRALPSMMAAERLARGLPTEITANLHAGRIEHVHTPDLTDVAEILTGLHQAGALRIDRLGVQDVGEVVDAESEPVYSDETDIETDSISSS